MGRPSRQSRSASIQSPSHSQNDPVYDWNERIPTTVASADEDVIMAMDPTDALVYPLNFLNWFPDFGNPNDIFALPGSGATPAVSYLSANVGGHKPFNPEIDVTSPALTRSPGEGQPETNRGESEKDKGFTAGMGQESQAELLTQICKLNVGLLQHPLHADKDKTGSMRGLASANISQPAEENGPLSTNLKLSDLCIGKLLELTYQLKDLVARIRSREDGTPQKIECLDQSTALMVLSCYTRLEILYSRTLEILHQVRNGERQLKDANMLMSELVIDGFPVNGCYDLQLNFLVYLFEQTHDRLHHQGRKHGWTGGNGETATPNVEGAMESHEERMTSFRGCKPGDDAESAIW
ncbi:hypothetical protein SCUP515_02204 [Seiridium cupressi]